MARQEAEQLVITAEEAPAAAPKRRALLSPVQWPVFASLRHRNYRLLWIGSLFANTGDWMDQVALNWLVRRYPLPHRAS